MPFRFLIVFCLFAISLPQAFTAEVTKLFEPGDEQVIRDAFARYHEAINAGDVDGVIALLDEREITSVMERVMSIIDGKTTEEKPNALAHFRKILLNSDRFRKEKDPREKMHCKILGIIRTGDQTGLVVYQTVFRGFLLAMDQDNLVAVSLTNGKCRFALNSELSGLIWEVEIGLSVTPTIDPRIFDPPTDPSSAPAP